MDYFISINDIYYSEGINLHVSSKNSLLKTA